MSISAYHAGAWRTITSIRAYHAGAWRTISQVWAFHAGSWRQISGTPAPAPAPPPPPGSAFVLTVSQSAGTSECFIKATGPKSCTARSTWTATPAHNAGTVTYAWSLPTNTGSFTFVGSTTSASVVLQTIGNVGGKTCTLLCTANDTLTTTSTSTTVTHIHSDS